MSEYSRDPNEDMDSGQILQEERIRELEEQLESVRNSLRAKEERMRHDKEARTKLAEEQRERLPAVDNPERYPAPHFTDNPTFRIPRGAETAEILVPAVVDEVLKQDDLSSEGEDMVVAIERSEAGKEPTTTEGAPELHHRHKFLEDVDYDRIPKVDNPKAYTNPISFDQLTPEGKARIIAFNQLIEDGTITPVAIPLSFKTYQAGAKKTAVYNRDARVLYPALGLVGEVGEVIEKVMGMANHAGLLANQVKKIIRDDDCECDTPRKHDIAKELGGVLWYCAAIATDLELSLSDIAQGNLDVLESRQERGVIQGDGDNR